MIDWQTVLNKPDEQPSVAQVHLEASQVPGFQDLIISFVATKNYERHPSKTSKNTSSNLG